MAKRDKRVAGIKSVLDDGRPKSALEFLEAVQGLEANGTLDTSQTTTGIPILSKTAPKMGAKRFSELAPFERSEFDYEKYCTEIAAGLVRQKRRKK